jgi:hypothetical protein
MKYQKSLCCIVVLLFLIVGCSKKNMVGTKSTRVVTDKSIEHYSVDNLEKVDRTIKENSNNPIYIIGENGALIEPNNTDNKILYRRRFIIDFEINQYCYPEIKQSYKECDFHQKSVVFQNASLLKTSEIVVTKTNQCWLKAEDQFANLGWICIGTLDPYKDSNWAIIGSIEFNDHKMMLRKYTKMFSIGGNQPAYDRPSLKTL